MNEASHSEGDWKKFEEWLTAIRAEVQNSRSSPVFFFRGQQDSEWPLETTLERSWQGGMTFDEYYDLIVARIGPAVETLTGVPCPSYDKKLVKRFAEDDTLLAFPKNRLPTGDLYRYMVYLRHHGFPSPYSTGHIHHM
jgi:hypothetical protein